MLLLFCVLIQRIRGPQFRRRSSNVADAQDKQIGSDLRSATRTEWCLYFQSSSVIRPNKLIDYRITILLQIKERERFYWVDRHDGSIYRISEPNGRRTGCGRACMWECECVCAHVPYRIHGPSTLVQNIHSHSNCCPSSRPSHAIPWAFHLLVVPLFISRVKIISKNVLIYAYTQNFRSSWVLEAYCMEDSGRIDFS